MMPEKNSGQCWMLNCKEAGDSVCTHTMCDAIEEELLGNAMKHEIEIHGYTEDFERGSVKDFGSFS